MSNYFPYQSPRNSGDPPQIPIWVIFILFFISPPLAFAVFVLRGMIGGSLFSGKRSLKGLRSAPYRLEYYPPEPAQKHPSAAEDMRHTVPGRPETKRQGKRGSRLSLLITAAAVITLIYGISAVSEPIRMLTYGLFSVRNDLWSLFSGLCSIAGSGLLFGYAARLRKLARLRRNLKNAVGNRDNITLAEICRVLSCSEKNAVDVAEGAIDQGELGEHAFFDHSSDTLVIRGEAPRPAAPTPVENTDSPNKYQHILEELHRINEAIPGEEMSTKISRLEDISAKIFELAENDPGKLPQLRKFMNYYLPTSLKLLNTYAQLDAQGIDGENITQGKREIESAMDTLCEAFANQLDKLFTSDAIDVSTDIAAMQAMLAQDGLADSDLTLPD